MIQIYFQKNDESIIEINNIVIKFENATGAILNRNKKTKIYGLGAWNKSSNWPLKWLKGEIISFKTLGIIYSNDFQVALATNWDQALAAIQSKIRSITIKKLTMYQKVVIVNSVILSKLWYIAHIYPLPMLTAKKINKEIYEYVWGMKNNPINRHTLSLPREKGGLGLNNVVIKAKCILSNTFLKAYNSPYTIKFMMYYYNIIRTGPLFNSSVHLNKVHYVGTQYYIQIIETIVKCLHIPKFPDINSKTMYLYLMPKDKPKIEEMYDSSIFRWSSMWKCISFKYIHVKEREIIFKYMHEILPTRKRLGMISQGEVTSECKFCGAEESNIHFTYQCIYYKPVIEWFKELVFKCCNFNPNMTKILMFDISNVNTQERNTCIILVATFICNIWKARRLDLPPMVAIKLLKDKILYNKKINQNRSRNKFLLFFTEVNSNLKQGNI